MSHTPVPWDVQNKGNLGCRSARVAVVPDTRLSLASTLHEIGAGVNLGCRSARYEIVAGINVNGEKNLPTICKMPDLSERSYANAAFIIRACNAHEDLLEACKAVMSRFEQTGEPWMHAPAMVLARAAIAKAEDTANQPAPQG